MFCPCDNFLVHCWWWIRRQGLGIEEIPNPYSTLFITTNNGGFAVTKAAATSVGLVGVTGEIVQHLSRCGIHEANMRIECGHKDGLIVFCGYDGCNRF